jgi:phage terminase small subunit
MGKTSINPITGLQNPNARQRQFAQAYVKCFNITQAAESTTNLRGAAAYQTGRRMLDIPYVKKYVEFLRDQAMEEMGFTKERVIAELCKISFSDMGNFITWSSEWSEEQHRYVHRVIINDSAELDTTVIKTVKINKNGQLEIDLYDKLNALDKLCKILGLNVSEKVEITGKDGGTIKIEDVREKLIRKIDAIANKGESGTETGDSEQSNG